MFEVMLIHNTYLNVDHELTIVRRVARWSPVQQCYLHESDDFPAGYVFTHGLKSVAGARRSLHASLRNDGAGFKRHAKFVIHEIRFEMRAGVPDRSDVTIYCEE
jgi:hypothetical protein